MGAVILFPAIDLKGGECVRLKLGDMNEATVYNTDPAAQAHTFQQAGHDKHCGNQIRTPGRNTFRRVQNACLTIKKHKRRQGNQQMQ